MHALKLRFSRRDQVPNLRYVLYIPVPLELFPRILHRLSTVRLGDLVQGADDGAPEGEDALALEEVLEAEGWLFGAAGCGWRRARR